MDKTAFLEYLHNEDFTALFTECGWRSPSTTTSFTITIGDHEFEIREVAQKGFRIYSCAVEQLPPASIRRTLDAKLRKHSHAYLIIFTVRKEAFHHQWLVPVDAVDKRRLVVLEYADDTHAETLRAKIEGISFGMDEMPTILDVVARVNTQFVVNASDVTKKFYEKFRKQHDAFANLTTGIDAKVNRDWYASVMLNRLMFCYFIQKKGFFMDKYGNADCDYLQHKLHEVVLKKGQDKFFGSFYRGFLKGLFQEGLNSPKRSQKFIDTYGRIPYLNGGMFEAHQLEVEHPDIDVPDKVFQDLFDFFDEWRWHLDDRIERDGRDINPDVLGYIFEQYINDRSQMGAYYTKEDITEYIGRNCILPYLFEVVKKADPKVFAPNGPVWSLLKSSNDAYVFSAMKKGVALSLPDEIEKGVDTTKPNLIVRRAEWNKQTPEAYALPTEIWRETVARRQRYAEVLEKINTGSITDIHDFITYNLNIRAFAEDLIRNANDHLFVKHFYDALRAITILDPTCGSGAFLFAALNILEPLYEACLDRMEEPANARYFKDELVEIKDKYRSNRQYFIYKNIILRNLYGVDIMHEATEIARLRLFLKMVAVVEADPAQENLGLDPLPDVDFNIRCGNTLVGYASPAHLEKSLKSGSMSLFADEELAKIAKKAADVADSCIRFRKEQLAGNSAFYYRKKELSQMIADLGDQLDETLAKMDYGIDRASANGRKLFNEWRQKTHPFHWYTEFYNIIVDNGGFDVIIGNPPYVEYSVQKIGYAIKGYQTEDCGNLYAYVIERCVQISSNNDIGMIVPTSSISTVRMQPLQRLLAKGGLYHSTFGFRPAKLFDGGTKANLHLSIVLMTLEPNGKIRSLNHIKWPSNFRKYLFDTLPCYACDLRPLYEKTGRLIRVASNKLLRVYDKILPFESLEHSLYPSEHKVYYRTTGGLHYRAFTLFPTASRKESSYSFATDGDMLVGFAALASNLWNLYYYGVSNCLDVAKYDILSFPMGLRSMNCDVRDQLIDLSVELNADIKQNSNESVRKYKEVGDVVCYQINMRDSKAFIDAIDKCLSKHFGFTDEELDLVINYDIKYRLSEELAEE